MKKIKWLPTAKRFVVFLDIMGFRDLVFRNTHQEVLETMEQLYQAIKEIKEDAKKRLLGKPHGWDTFNNTVVRPVIFSDSVLLFSSDDTTGSVEHIIWQANSIITHALKNHIAIKGAMSYGEQTANFGKSLYFGKPLIDAWTLQNELELYGVILHHTVEKYLVDQGWMAEMEETSICRYPTPLKQGKVKHYLIDWPNIPMQASKFNPVPDLYCQVSGNTRRYVDNTVKFVDWAKRQRKTS